MLLSATFQFAMVKFKQLYLLGFSAKLGETTLVLRGSSWQQFAAIAWEI